MTGLERNADVVKLASYAPLLANDRLRPVAAGHDLVRQRRVLGLGQLRGPEAVHEQRRRPGGAEHGDRHAVATASRSPARSACPPGPPPRPTTTCRVTAPDGTVLFADDFSGGAGQWTPQATRLLGGRGRRATSSPTPPRENTMVTAGDVTAWPTTTCTLKATKTVRRRGLPGRLRGQGHRQLLLVEPRRLEQHPGARSRRPSDGGKETVVAKPDTDRDRAAPTTSGSRCAAARSAVPGRPEVGQLHRRQGRPSRSPGRHPRRRAPAT